MVLSLKAMPTSLHFCFYLSQTTTFRTYLWQCLHWFIHLLLIDSIDMYMYIFYALHVLNLSRNNTSLIQLKALQVSLLFVNWFIDWYVYLVCFILIGGYSHLVQSSLSFYSSSHQSSYISFIIYLVSSSLCSSSSYIFASFRPLKPWKCISFKTHHYCLHLCFFPYFT